jgi:SET domain-containing protein
MLLVRTVLRPSSIHGIGLFAAERIAAGAPVWRFVREFDRVLPPVIRLRFPQYLTLLQRYAQRCPMTDQYVLCVDDAKYMNHSDDPNVLVRAPLWDATLTHDAIRDIEEGDELTCDYRIGDADPFEGFAA